MPVGLRDEPTRVTGVPSSTAWGEPAETAREATAASGLTRARAVDDRILGLGLDRVVGRPGDDGVSSRAGVHRVAEAGHRGGIGRARSGGKCIHEELVIAGQRLVESHRIRRRGDHHVIGAGGGQSQVDDRGIGVLKRVIVVCDDLAAGIVDGEIGVERALVVVSGRRPLGGHRSGQGRRHELEVDQGAGLGGERVKVGVRCSVCLAEVSDHIGGGDIEDLVGVDALQVGVGHDQRIE